MLILVKNYKKKIRNSGRESVELALVLGQTYAQIFGPFKCRSSFLINKNRVLEHFL